MNIIAMQYIMNKFGALLDDITNSEAIPVSDADILKMANNQTKIVLYEQLGQMAVGDFMKLFRPETNNSIILLYQLDSGFGHWICIIYDVNDSQKFFHFCPYGLHPDSMLDSKYPFRDLTRLYQESRVPVDVSTFKYQKVRDNVNTCGRWSAVRALYWYMSNDEFKSYITTTKPGLLIKNLDDLITVMTMLPLDYIQDRNETLDGA